ncbi:TetR/AcrR family transcriptional regulator [Gordonia sp. PP30]|uniref:TetR/AcrR family transcriptional regulator n=1 Tax=unclassified Gordonia (in: high G+C Gram-positive bacteria) TaxID=2657482 RepID=UPI001FFFAD9B|nr:MULTISPECIES: TetR/AcrR family transcriptional regulator [unclassified Gordonia (in: high G+C Gram-positive bacteria)]UQE75689.1 TetR/AcrR family transcriptional regulator [Gordonia sp. PP30]
MAEKLTASDRARLRRERIENDVFDAAARLFAERGFAGTSIQDIANDLGVSRTSLYYYVPNKDELLARIVHDLTERGLRVLEEQRARPVPLEQQFSDSVREMTRLVAANPARFRLLQQSEAFMPPEVARQHRRNRRAMLDAMIRLIEDGQNAGILRSADPRLAAFALFGMWNWTAYWVRDTDNLDTIVDEFATIALRGLLADGDGTDRRATDVLENARRELATLALMLDRQDESTPGQR